MKKLFLTLAVLASAAFAQQQNTRAAKILDQATATGFYEVFRPLGPYRTFQASGTTTSGVGAADIDIQVSNDCTNFIVVGTISLAFNTSAATDGFATQAHWQCVRARVVSISGTGAKVDAWIGN